MKILAKLTSLCKQALITGVLFWLFLMISTPGFAQVIDDVQNSFKQYVQNNLHEKIYVHTDKEFYLAGEVLWFKIYNIDGNTNKPLNLSKVAYAELLDKDNNAVVQIKIAIKNGRGDGSIYLPVSVNTGNYKLSVYTTWMKNYDQDGYFQKTISITNTLKPSSVALAKPATEKYDIQFMPEGGYMLAGFNCKVGFRAVNQFGLGINFSGVIVNEHNDTAAYFKPIKFGIGSFTFKPASGHIYTAVVRVGTKTIKQQLPAVNTQGYAMQLTSQADNSIRVSVHSGSGNNEPVYLFAYTEQQIKVTESGVITNGTAEFAINKKALGEGLSHLTVFNNAGQPVCERLFFKRPQQTLLITALSDKNAYQPRKKVEIEISANSDGRPQLADMSLSVYRQDSLQLAKSADIQSYLWLTSELKGNVEGASYYLNNKTADADAALDNLLLTQGWRQFKWTDLLQNKPAAFKYIPEHVGHIIYARITNPETKLPVKSIPACLSVQGKRVQFYTAASDSVGVLAFNTRSFYGSSELVVQTVNEADSLLKIEILSPFSDHTSKNDLADLRLSKTNRGLLEQYSLGVQAQNIYQGDKVRLFYNPPVDSIAFYGNPKFTYMLDDYTRFTTMEEVLREYVHEVIVGRSQKKFHFRLLNNAGDALMDNNPLVLLDGIPIFDMDKIVAVDPLKIKKIEVVTERYYAPPLEQDGVLNFTSYKNDLAGYEIDPHALVIDYEGLQLKRDFFSPVYEAPEQINNHLPDFRSVLYWNPNITTDAKGKCKLTFYTSDEPGIYSGMLQGITDNAQAGASTFAFEVKK